MTQATIAKFAKNVIHASLVNFEYAEEYFVSGFEEVGLTTSELSLKPICTKCRD